MKNKEEYLKETNNKVYEQLAYAETKNGVLAGILGAVLFAIVGIISIENLLYWARICFAVIGGTLFIAFIIILLSFLPNTKVLKGSPTQNLYFWGSIAEFDDIGEYEEAIEKYENVNEHLEAQNIQVAKIIKRKYKFFNIAIRIAFAALMPLYWFCIVWTILTILRRKIRQLKRKKRGVL